MYNGKGRAGRAVQWIDLVMMVVIVIDIYMYIGKGRRSETSMYMYIYMYLGGGWIGQDSSMRDLIIVYINNRGDDCKPAAVDIIYMMYVLYI